MPRDEPSRDVGIARDPSFNGVGAVRAIDKQGTRFEFVGVTPVREEHPPTDEDIEVLNVRTPDGVPVFDAVVIGVVNGEEIHTDIEHPTRRTRLALEQMFEGLAARTMVP